MEKNVMPRTMRHYLVILSESENTGIFEFSTAEDRRAAFRMASSLDNQVICLGIDVDAEGLISITSD